MNGVEQVVWTPGVSLEALERQVIQAAFSFYRGNKSATAQSLGIAIRTLEAKLEKLSIEQVEGMVRAKQVKSEREQQLHYHRFGRPPADASPVPAAPEKTVAPVAPPVVERKEPARTGSNRR